MQFYSLNLTLVISLHTVCSIWPYQVQPLRVRVDLEVMAMNGYAAFPKSPRLEPCHHWFNVISRILVGVSYLSAEMQSVYSTVPTDFLNIWTQVTVSISNDGNYFNMRTYMRKHLCLWCNGYRRRKWTRRHEFKSRTRLITFHIALIPLGKVWIQLFSLQLWVNSSAD